MKQQKILIEEARAVARELFEQIANYELSAACWQMVDRLAAEYPWLRGEEEGT